MEINLQLLFKQMLNDTEIIKEYSLISKKEVSAGGYATHGLCHVSRVINNCERISHLLGLDDIDISAIKIAALLHDIGCLSDGKDGHAKRSEEWARSYLQNKGLSENVFEKITAAIGEHSKDAKSIYGKILLFSDKIDICDKRILPSGLLIAGNRQYAHIKSIDFIIKDKTLVVDFHTDSQIDVLEMNEYYFTKKVYQGIAELACCFGLSHEIRINKIKLPIITERLILRPLHMGDA